MATGFLASVRNCAEARVALDNGADIIDLKEPANGSLGAVDPAILADVVRLVAGRKPVSAVAGDLPMDPGIVVDAVLRRRAADLVKIGFFPGTDAARRAVCDRLAADAAEVSRIGVLFADDGLDLDFLTVLADTGFAGAMLDTRAKDGRRLLDHLSPAQLAGFVDRARALGLKTGLAGALEAPDVPRLLPLGADYLGFRGALTAGGRDAALDATRVSHLAALMRAPAGAPADAPLDRIFMRDYVLDMEVGAYGFERGRKQRVRFTLEADIRQRVADPRHMADIYSYDLMMDAVRGIVARGHTDLVETLAEELAATILADARVEGVMVRVEKLDLGPAATGIEIRRGRGGAYCGAASN